MNDSTERLRGALSHIDDYATASRFATGGDGGRVEEDAVRAGPGVIYFRLIGDSASSSTDCRSIALASGPEQAHGSLRVFDAMPVGYDARSGQPARKEYANFALSVISGSRRRHDANVGSSEGERGAMAGSGTSGGDHGGVLGLSLLAAHRCMSMTIRPLSSTRTEGVLRLQLKPPPATPRFTKQSSGDAESERMGAPVVPGAAAGSGASRGVSRAYGTMPLSSSDESGIRIIQPVVTTSTSATSDASRPASDATGRPSDAAALSSLHDRPASLNGDAYNGSARSTSNNATGPASPNKQQDEPSHQRQQGQKGNGIRRRGEEDNQPDVRAGQNGRTDHDGGASAPSPGKSRPGETILEEDAQDALIESLRRDVTGMLLEASEYQKKCAAQRRMAPSSSNDAHHVVTAALQRQRGILDALQLRYDELALCANKLQDESLDCRESIAAVLLEAVCLKRAQTELASGIMTAAHATSPAGH